MSVTYVMTIPVQIDDNEAHAMIGVSWPISMLSKDFARRAKISYEEKYDYIQNHVHYTGLYSHGKTTISISVGGIELKKLPVIVTITRCRCGHSFWKRHFAQTRSYIQNWRSRIPSDASKSVSDSPPYSPF